MARIEMKDSMMDVVIKLSEGNPGALSVCMQILKDSTTDPDNALGGLGVLLSLDTLEIYGSHIWLLYKDICGENLENMLGVLRAWQLGFLTENTLKEAVLNCNRPPWHHGLDVENLVAQVKERLPNFGGNSDG
jgi:hypothetical protein